jgi:hypothetical protein
MIDERSFSATNTRFPGHVLPHSCNKERVTWAYGMVKKIWVYDVKETNTFDVGNNEMKTNLFYMKENSNHDIANANHDAHAQAMVIYSIYMVYHFPYMVWTCTWNHDIDHLFSSTYHEKVVYTANKNDY